MLFETSNKQPGGRPAFIPVQQPPTTGIRNPPLSNINAAKFKTSPVTGYNSSMQRPVKTTFPTSANALSPQKVASGTPITGQQKKQVKGWPSYQQAAKQPQASMVRPTLQAQKGSGASAFSQQKKQVKGWPGYQRVAKQAKPSTASGLVMPNARPIPTAMRRPVKRGIYQPGPQNLQRSGAYRPIQKGYGGSLAPGVQQKGLTGWSNFRRGIQNPQAYGSAILPQKPLSTPAITQPRQKPAIGMRFYDASAKSYSNYPGSNAQPSAYSTWPDTLPAQTTITGWPSNQGNNATQPTPQHCDCSKCAHTGNSPGAVAVPDSDANHLSPQPVPPQPVCPTCGLNTQGCTILRGFALNSILLNVYHEKQLRKLAAAILQQNSNAVVATGHTNSSKTEELIENLGERRALAVVTELKRQLSKLKPGAQKNIFWKTVSKAITQPETASHSGNRRVEICIRQLR